MPIRAETSLTIDHQENVGKKREKRKYGATQEKAASSELRGILLVMKITFGAPNFVGILQIFQKCLQQSTYRKSEENPRTFDFAY